MLDVLSVVVLESLLLALVGKGFNQGLFSVNRKNKTWKILILLIQTTTPL